MDRFASPYRNSTSGYRGVTRHKKNGVWVARICVNKRIIYLGSFQTAQEAAAAYAAAYKNYAATANLPEPVPTGQERVRHAIAYEGEDCLIWQYARDAEGYARVTVDRRTGSASRRVCEGAHGPAPSPAHQAAHSCGNGHLGCVNKRHISWKTPVENNADKKLHGTYQVGEKNSRAKLTDRQVTQIRAEAGSETLAAIARKFGVSQTTVWCIVHRLRWAHA